MRIFPVTCAVCGTLAHKTLHDLPAPITRHDCPKCGRETTHFVAFGEPLKERPLFPAKFILDQNTKPRTQGEP